MPHIYCIPYWNTHTHVHTHISFSLTYTYTHTHTHIHTHTHMSHHDPLHIRMSHVTHMNQACLTIRRIISQTKLSHVSGMSHTHMCLSQYDASYNTLSSVMLAVCHAYICVCPNTVFTSNHHLCEYHIHLYMCVYLYQAILCLSMI